MYRLIFIAFLFVHQLSFAQSIEVEAKNVLNQFHEAAATADTKAYFSLMHRDFIFLGTDATERWTKDSFASFVKPYFSRGIGWRYTPTQQNISQISEDVLFFDELLVHKSYGQCRGSGVLIKVGEQWLLSQYNLSIPLPNDIAKDIVKQVESYKKSEKH
ncbi:hypothetical protein tloyanaT_36370 [Thalassotalea loyana]|uniref:SnoaL-like domain-containing protein n=1 Tax=Thalassotalea loyana TaxID=280483 RepID=A0ABQ6HI49_9GAMM|nr:nuclear transport factor 2 family protein [Thalassotalea loyana]GLX87384.1 hypothetical protein tloyanaT_36370 [Thalassotalea loyana]